MLVQRISRRIRGSLIWQQSQEWYLHRSSRDKKALQVMSAFGLIALIYFCLWQPVAEWAQKQEADYQYQKENHQWMVEHLDKARKLQNASPKGDVQTILTNQAKLVGITLAKVRPDRQGIAVWMEDAAYQKLLKWLVLLQSQHRISVQQIRIDTLPEDGRVKSYILLNQ